ncbi:MAG: T9SS type A sorting domain-containing protein [Cytophagales bacterium]|nr:T9SS type A sorting domain-containing protein [Cytophagales bacterium]
MPLFSKCHIFFALLFFYTSNIGAQGKLWGVTSSGGTDGFGVIFSTSTDGTEIISNYNFKGINARSPMGSLTLCSNGKFYGMAWAGGVNNLGVLFEYDLTSNLFTNRIDFDGLHKGSHPMGSLTLSSSGMLYGMTSNGGVNNKGVLFEFDPSSNSFTKKIDFDGIAKGSYPRGNVTIISNGKIFGMTSMGGVNDVGIIFEFDPSTNSYTKRVDFDGATKGSNPFGSLTLGNNGNLYGMTNKGGVKGGTVGSGVLFEYNPNTNAFVKRFDFGLDFTVNASAGPHGSLTMGSNGKFYGMTYYGGANFKGILFEYDPTTNAFNKKIDFNGTNGGMPYGSLTLGSNGKLYGMTSYGGKGSGALFEYDPVTNSLTKSVDFDGLTTGSYPYGDLAKSNDGKFYGMTNGGGTLNIGVLFEYDLPNNSFIKKVDFGSAASGGAPFGNLTEGINGKLYGMASVGLDSLGVLFEYDPVGNIYSKKIDFGGLKGISPTGNLIDGGNGNLFGMTYSGGINDQGVLFEYNPRNSSFTKKIDFDGTTTGSNPIGNLVINSNGKFYGITSFGGANGNGILFEYDQTTNSIVKKIDFDVNFNSSGGLTSVNNGKFYGTSYFGGSNNYGVLFEYDPTNNTLTKKLDFDGTTKGGHPNGSFVIGSNGKIYGTTTYGGANYMGVLFEYDATSNSLTKKVDFDGVAKGSNPSGNLTLSSNGKLFGITSNGGANDKGVMFEFDPNTNSFIKKVDFDGTNNGSRPYGGLLLLKVRPDISWNNPKDVVYGTALSNTQLNATSNVEGAFVYTPASGTVLNAGNQDLSVTFIPTDLINYSTITKKVTLNVTKANQVITFSDISDKQLPNAPFILSATVSSFLPVTFSTTSTKITLSENQVTILDAGKASIVASQPGNGNYNAATSVTREFCIKPAKPSVTATFVSGTAKLTSNAANGNQWYLNGAVITGATNNSYTATSAGTYKAQVTIDNCLSDFSNDVPVVITGDLPNGNASVSLYPNPTAGILFIAGLEPETNECSIVDLLGRPIIMNLEKSGDQHRLTTESLVDGVYMLRVKQSNSLLQLKFVKKN